MAREASIKKRLRKYLISGRYTGLSCKRAVHLTRVEKDQDDHYTVMGDKRVVNCESYPRHTMCIGSTIRRDSLGYVQGGDEPSLTAVPTLCGAATVL